MKVLLCSPPPGFSGGISRWTEHIINYYNLYGKADLELLLFPMPRKKAGEFSIFHRLISGCTEYSTIILKYIFELKKSKPKIIHLVSSASISLLKDLIMAKIAQILNKKVVVHFHFGRIPAIIAKSGWELYFLKRVVLNAHRVIVIDSQSYSALLNEGFKNIVFLPNPLTEKIGDLIEKNQHLNRESNKILYAGHMYASKGIFELIEASIAIPDVKLVMLGSLDETTRVKLIEKSKLKPGHWLELKGNVDFEEVVNNMLTCSLFVLPSYTEGFPNVILESMACGCPIIATNVGAIPEMLSINTDNQCGIVIEPRNTVLLLNAIKTLLSDYPLAVTLGNNARRRVNEQYNIGAVWRQLISVWESS